MPRGGKKAATAAAAPLIKDPARYKVRARADRKSVIIVRIGAAA